MPNHPSCKSRTKISFAIVLRNAGGALPGGFVQKPNENLFCYGDGSGDELDESGRLKIRHHKHYFNPAGEKLR